VLDLRLGEPWRGCGKTEKIRWVPTKLIRNNAVANVVFIGSLTPEQGMKFLALVRIARERLNFVASNLIMDSIGERNYALRLTKSFELNRSI
jgi:hypothetical protein